MYIPTSTTTPTPTTPSTTVRSSGSSAPVATSTVFNSLAQASQAGYHGQNVNIKGKGVQKVEFSDPKFNAAMKKKSSDNEDKRQAREKLSQDVQSSRAGPKTGSTSQTTTSKQKVAKDFEDPSDNFAGMINKGGLINKPKRTPKKPRGKGLGSK